MELNKKVFGIGLLVAAVLLFGILGVVKSAYDQQAGILCDKLHQDPNYNPAMCPVVQSQNTTSWLFVSGFAIAFLVFLVGTYVLFSKSTTERFEIQKKEMMNVDLKTLDEEEKVVYLFLKEKKGSVYQSEITSSTGFTKVKISRILDRLESKNILERKRRGMTNIVVLH